VSASCSGSSAVEDEAGWDDAVVVSEREEVRSVEGAVGRLVEQPPRRASDRTSSGSAFLIEADGTSSVGTRAEGGRIQGLRHDRALKIMLQFGRKTKVLVAEAAEFIEGFIREALREFIHGGAAHYEWEVG
jgi:hypothetical protein